MSKNLVGILTQPLGNNYGGILQNYALQQVLLRMGYTPITLNITYHEPQWHFADRCMHGVWRLLKKWAGDPAILSPDIRRQWMIENRPGVAQQRFIEQHISVADFAERDNLPMEPMAYVVGSDQVWRPRFSPCLKHYFLDFVDTDAKRIAYAASFGTDKWEGNDSDTQMAQELIGRFDAVSVREHSGVSICRQLFHIDAVQTLDPTLLLVAADYHAIMKRSEMTRYAAVYILDRTAAAEAWLHHLCQKLGLTPVFIGRYDTNSGYQSIEEWLGLIAQCDMVLTDSFHGTVFSLLLHKPFRVWGNEGRGLSRIDSLLHSVGIDTYVPKDIDWELVDKLLAEQRVLSMNFLAKALQG